MRCIHECMHRRLYFTFSSFFVFILFILKEDQGFLPNSQDAPSPLLRHKRINKVNGQPSVRNMGADVTNELQSISNRFYIYDDDVIAQTIHVNKFRREHTLEVEFDHVQSAIDGERNMLKALKDHALRTRNPKEAQLFVIPTPVTELLAYGCHWETCTWYDEAFDALTKNEFFAQHQGHHHVLIVQSWPLFNKRYSAYMPAMSRNYRRLENVTIANDFDPFGSMELHQQFVNEPSLHSDFESLFEEETPITNAFSVGLGFHRPFPLRLATFDKFQTSKYFVFYHARNVDFSFGSEKFRNVLLDESVANSLPLSTIGYDTLSKQNWESDITHSKYCLVVREHAPHSYSLSNAVRAGCLPVIVSDYYQAYGGPFKSSISTHDFAIYINEEDFLQHPIKELRKLQDIPLDTIKQKIKHLSIAQRILAPDHPQPLFVEAFVREAMVAQTHVLPHVAERMPVQIHYGDVTISGKCFNYRYPSSLMADRTEIGKPMVIVGVLSQSQHFTARHSIRETWASKHDNTVFFVVAGPWDDSLANEFETYGDMVWLDMEEHADHATFKTQAFFHAVDTHVGSYDYVMKANDDNYVFIPDVGRHLSNYSANYWGDCRTTQGPVREPGDVYPPFASGMYALSRNFTKCAMKQFEGMNFMPREDVAMRILAEECGVTCSRSGWPHPWSDKNFVYHGLNNSADMVMQHWIVLKNRKMGEWAV